MSLITRCPACETLFKVVPDQLRISEGWVRCGQCDEIFDALLHLLPDLPVQETPATPLAEPAEQLVETNAEEATPAAAEVTPDLDDEEEFDALPVVLEPDEPPLIAAESAPLDLSMADLSVPVAQTDPQDIAPELDGELSPVSFLRDKKNDSYWRKPIIRSISLLLTLLLLLGLLGQIMLQERDQIIAQAPATKPFFKVICGPLNCALSPLRRIDAIVIDSASFIKIKGDSYRLNFTVKNTALTSLAMPAIELTLTDSLDQPVIRHVFMPSELGVKSDTLTAGAEWPASLALAVKATGTADRVAGYRLLAFYP